jgi:hypothetical protein
MGSAIGNWLYHWLGMTGTGPIYGFLSGAGSDISELAIVGALIGGARKLIIIVHKHHQAVIEHHQVVEAQHAEVCQQLAELHKAVKDA